MMKTNGKISISRSTSAGDHKIRIELIDESSSVKFAVIEMSLEDFGGAITGLSHQPCTIELRGLNAIGKVREVKQENIPLERSLFRITAEQANKIVAPYEVDGWKAHNLLNDLNNHHRWHGDNVTVTFVRFIEDQL